FSLNLGKNISLFSPKIQDIKHNSPDSFGITKYLLISFGATIGCFFSIRLLKPCNNEPSEKATLANRAVEIVISLLLRIKNISIIRFEAPIIFTGFAALSVETQKYFLTPLSIACCNVLSVLKTLTLIIRINV